MMKMTKKQVLAKFFGGKKGIENQAIGNVDALMLITIIENLEQQTGRQLLSYGKNPLEYLSQSVTIGEVAKLFYCADEEERDTRIGILFELKTLRDNKEQLDKLLVHMASIAGKQANKEFFSSKMKSHVVHDMPYCNWEYLIVFVEYDFPWSGPTFSAVSDDATVMDVAQMFTYSLNRKNLDRGSLMNETQSQPEKVAVRKPESIADNPEEIQKVIRVIAKEAGFKGENLDDFSKCIFINLATEGFGGEYLEILFNSERILGYYGPASVKASDTVYDVATMFWK